MADHATDEEGQAEEPDGEADIGQIAATPARLLALLLGGCGSSVLSGSSLNIFDSKKATTGTASRTASARMIHLLKRCICSMTGATNLVH